MTVFIYRLDDLNDFSLKATSRCLKLASKKLSVRCAETYRQKIVNAQIFFSFFPIKSTLTIAYRCVEGTENNVHGSQPPKVTANLKSYL